MGCGLREVKTKLTSREFVVLNTYLAATKLEERNSEHYYLAQIAYENRMTTRAIYDALAAFAGKSGQDFGKLSLNEFMLRFEEPKEQEGSEKQDEPEGIIARSKAAWKAAISIAKGRKKPRGRKR